MPSRRVTVSRRTESAPGISPPIMENIKCARVLLRLLPRRVLVEQLRPLMHSPGLFRERFQDIRAATKSHPDFSGAATD